MRGDTLLNLNSKPKKKKVKAERHPIFPFLTDVHLFDEDEGTFTDFGRRQKVYVHLIPAPWPRVIMLSLVYAMAVNFVKIVVLEFVGEPQWQLVASKDLPTPAQPGIAPTTASVATANTLGVQGSGKQAQVTAP